MNQKGNLTPREQQIFNMLTNGKTPKEIAYELKISYNTLIVHQKNMYRKLGVQNISEFLIKFRPIGEVLEMETLFKACKYIDSQIKKYSLEPIGDSSALIDFWIPLFGGKFILTVTRTIKENNGKPEECVAITGLRYEKNGNRINIAGAYFTPDTSNLTPREQQIFNMLLDGKTPREIACKLKISYHTVTMHQKGMYRKLGVQNINDFMTKFRPIEKALEIKTPLRISKKASKFWKNLL